ncbi:hypothetical protein PVAP13_7NG294148 [Panicum virgatum]|uniref:Uncharacterized protein n=1 Tax=Panicum virgatum TaxID=38727 RepID=A0A8T0Q4W3_PANVG|nr:hypothetical protein PVAP13_7NG294148 [Panicum virgatum]
MRLPIPTGWPSPEARPLHLPTAPAGTEAQQQQRPGGGRTLTAAGERRRGTARLGSARLCSAQWAAGLVGTGRTARWSLAARAHCPVACVWRLQLGLKHRTDGRTERSGAALHA